jgi:hypothetical protein
LSADVDDLKIIIRKLESRVDKLESRVKTVEEKSGNATPVVPSSNSEVRTTSAALATTPEEVDEEDNVDLFGSDSEVCLMCK